MPNGGKAKQSTIFSPAQRLPILRIAIPTPLRRLFDYLPPKNYTADELSHLTPGLRVLVPFGRSNKVGVIVELCESASVAYEKLKPVHEVLDKEPVFSSAVSAHMLELMQWASRYYQYPIGEVIANALPSPLRLGQGLQQEKLQLWQLTPAGSQLDLKTLSRSPRQQQLLTTLAEYRNGMSGDQLNHLLPNWRPVMKKLMAQQWAISVEINSDDTRLSIPVPQLDEAGQVRAESEAENNPHAADSTLVDLNPAQIHAISEVQQSLSQFSVSLLEGVTGSGKTEVYLGIIDACLKRGLQALVMVPEIGLTPQLLSRFHSRFPQTPLAVMHSGLSDKARLQAWQHARNGNARIVIGTRSAVTAPMPQLGVIIIDEEHDLSYKQQDHLRYSARDVAIKRAQLLAIPVLLGSATPALESLYNVKQGRYRHLRLPERAGDAQMPDIQILDVRSQAMDQGLSAQLLHGIREQLAAGRQVMLFLNRRGFAPTLMCHDCGWIAQCQRCDSHMTLYQTRTRLRCQHCGAERRVETHCPECQSEGLLAVGQGTERIEEALTAHFPDTPVLRIDRDTTRRRNAMQEMVDEVHKGRACILVGTQMLAKGHHFPNVTLVGIVDVDQGLFSADFRGAERMAQLLTQVAGRAGRAQHRGTVLIQTHHPDHPLLQELIKHGYDRFAELALEERQAVGLPPYAYMALLRAEAVTRDQPLLFLNQVRQQIQALNPETVELLGPVPAPMEKRAGRFRAQLMLQSKERAPLQRLLTTLLPELETAKTARQVRWSIDVDPLEMF